MAPFRKVCLQNQNPFFKIKICFAKLQRKSDTLVGCVNNLARAPSQLGGSKEARTDSALAKASPGDFYLLLPPGCEGSPIGIQNHGQGCLADWQYAVELAVRFHADKRSYKRI